MRVLVVSTWFPDPPTNGAKLRAHHLLRELARRHEVSLLSFAEPGEEHHASALQQVCSTIATVPGNPCKAGRLDRGRLFSRVPRSYAQTYNPAMQALVDRLLPGHDVAVAFQVGAAMYLAGHSTVPAVFEEAEVSVIRDAYINSPLGPGRVRRGLTWWKTGRFIRGLVEHFERTTVVSPVERERLGEIGCDLHRVRVVPNGVPRACLDRPAPPERQGLIYPGSVTYHANRDAVAYFAGDILPRITRERPEMSLTVTGAVGDVDVQGIAQDEPVHFTGHVRDVASAVAASAVCVVPLRIGGGTRLKILEAMALGTPVVSTPKGAEGLAVTHGDNILIATDPEEFARAVLRLLADPLLQRRLSQNGRALVKRQYTWEAIGGTLDDVLFEAVAAARGPASHSSRPAEDVSHAARA
jgi:polysaccharide biosynthesis protein PslH